MLDVYSPYVLSFLFALARIGGLVLWAPLFGGRGVSWPVRALLAVAIAAMIAPVCDAAPLASLSGNAGQLLVAAVREVGLGLVLGGAIVLLVAGLQAAGQVIGQMAGMSLAEVVDASSGAAAGFGRLFEMVGIAALLLTGGHRRVMAALLETFQWMPPGQVRFSTGWYDAVQQTAAQSFWLALGAAAPVLLALLLSALVVGMIHRLVPQLNTWSLGFSVNALAALGLVALTLGGVAWSFQNHVGMAVQTVTDAVCSPAETASTYGAVDE